MKKDLTKIKEEMQSAVIGAKNRYVKQLEDLRMLKQKIISIENVS